ncbi:MAG: hypothetical protein JKY89_10955 [Immundisolibacteraceae bacterium]|nr:hypothetical protein [Immundisolibacteraceae bacterium]
MVTRVTQPPTDRPIVEGDGSQSAQMRSWTKIITDQSLIIGTGNPEGVVDATEGATYQDSAGTASNIRYAKRDDNILGDKTKGWILI